MGNCSSSHSGSGRAKNQVNNSPSKFVQQQDLSPPINSINKRRFEASSVSSSSQIDVNMVASESEKISSIVADEHLSEQWKVFNDLDTQDEADMMALAAFFQTMTSSKILKEVDMTPQTEGLLADADIVGLDQIKIEKVGRLDSIMHNLDCFEIPAKSKVTIETTLDIIDCFRRGGKLATSSVHKILKDVYWMFKKLPNVREANISNPTQSVTVVGDLHGQYADLLYILDTFGPPSANNLYVFNGDFVDRGPASLQTILTLFALQLAEPTNVLLNRGNHEDAGICCVFGFMKECIGEYDEITFSMFVEVFRYLPLATVINSQIFVLHGGLFSQPGVLLEEIMEADRKEYNLQESKEETPPSRRGEESDTKDYLDQLIRDMLWSDPCVEKGRRPNPRGEGVHFGPDVTADFLRENSLSMVVRSHECVPLGFGQPYDGTDGKEILATIFSASNYSSSGNHGAVMRFSLTSSQGCKEIKPVPGSKESVSSDACIRSKRLFYTVHCWYMGDALEQERCLREATQASLANLIMKKRVSLQRAFEQLDPSGTSKVTVDQWIQVMESVTRLKAQWRLIMPLLLPDTGEDNGTVDYYSFLSNFQAQYGMGGSGEGDKSGKTMMDALYVNRKQLEALFCFFDKDGNGSITRAEFRQGCDYLNRFLPAEEKLHDVDHILDLIDFDKSNTIELNEFFEAFRLLDIKDGKLDGRIDIDTVAQKSTKMYTRTNNASNLMEYSTGAA